MRDPLITFELDGQSFAVPIGWVDGVAPLEQLVPLPGTDAAVLGLAPVRGTVVAVIDPRPGLELTVPEGDPTASSLVVVTTVSGRFGLAVDDVEVVLPEPETEVSTTVADGDRPVAGTATVGDVTWPLVDPERLVRSLVVAS